VVEPLPDRWQRGADTDRPRICLQAGHENTEASSLERLRGSTGAPGEMAFNLDLRRRVAAELEKRGFRVYQTDARANDDPAVTGQDWDLCLAIHYDADIYGRGGGFVDWPDPSIDAASEESRRIARAIQGVYFATTGIANVWRRRNDNTKLYYLWRYVTAGTPCVIIECGVGQHHPDDYDVLQDNRPLVVEGIVRGICKAFGVPYRATTPE
jgi:N-acetylmuramoyl-L-alanine amidase